jgi:hypothetical protein
VFKGENALEGYPDLKKPLIIVLRNYDEKRWSSESFLSDLGENWNIAYFEPRGVGETAGILPSTGTLSNTVMILTKNR